MPGKVKVKIVSGRNLPIMDRSNLTTDAYVEVKLGSTIYKTDVYRKSLNPVWNSEWFRFEMDDLELQDEPLQIRLMDHDTYSSNDAIGKVYLDLNPLLCNSSRGKDSSGKMISGWIPVYDTMHGIRGEVNLIVKVELFSDLNKFRQSSCGVRFFFTQSVPEGYVAHIMQGFVEELVVNDDPEYQWIDKIRTPRASNEARQTLFSKLSGEVQRRVGLKALELGGNAVIGYKQCFDLEGESGIVVRGIGTAAYLTKQYESQLSPTCGDAFGLSREFTELQGYRSFSKSGRSLRRRGAPGRAPRLQRRSFRAPTSSDTRLCILSQHKDGDIDDDDVDDGDGGSARKKCHDDTCLTQIHPGKSRSHVDPSMSSGSGATVLVKHGSIEAFNHRSSFRQDFKKFSKLKSLTSSMHSVLTSSSSSATNKESSSNNSNGTGVEKRLNVATSEPCIEVSSVGEGMTACQSFTISTMPLPSTQQPCHKKPISLSPNSALQAQSAAAGRLSNRPSPLRKIVQMECSTLPKKNTNCSAHMSSHSYEEPSCSRMNDSTSSSCMIHNNQHHRTHSETMSPYLTDLFGSGKENLVRAMSRSVTELSTNNRSVAVIENTQQLASFVENCREFESAGSNLDSNADEDSTSDTSMRYLYGTDLPQRRRHHQRQCEVEFESDTSKDFPKVSSSGNDGCSVDNDELSPVSEGAGFLLLRKKRGSRRKDRYSKSSLIKRASASFCERGYFFGGTERIREEVVKFFKRKKSSDDNESCSSSTKTAASSVKKCSKLKSSPYREAKFFFRRRRTASNSPASCILPGPTTNNPHRSRSSGQLFRSNSDSHSLGQTSIDSVPSVGSEPLFDREDDDSSQERSTAATAELYVHEKVTASIVPKLQIPEVDEEEKESSFEGFTINPVNIDEKLEQLEALNVLCSCTGTSNLRNVLELRRSKIVEIIKELGFSTESPLKLYISSKDALLVYEPDPASAPLPVGMLNADSCGVEDRVNNKASPACSHSSPAAFTSAHDCDRHGSSYVVAADGRRNNNVASCRCNRSEVPTTSHAITSKSSSSVAHAAKQESSSLTAVSSSISKYSESEVSIPVLSSFSTLGSSQMLGPTDSFTTSTSESSANISYSGKILGTLYDDEVARKNRLTYQQAPTTHTLDNNSCNCYNLARTISQEAEGSDQKQSMTTTMMLPPCPIHDQTQITTTSNVSLVTDLGLNRTKTGDDEHDDNNKRIVGNRGHHHHHHDISLYSNTSAINDYTCGSEEDILVITETKSSSCIIEAKEEEEIEGNKCSKNCSNLPESHAVPSNRSPIPEELLCDRSTPTLCNMNQMGTTLTGGVSNCSISAVTNNMMISSQQGPTSTTVVPPIGVATTPATSVIQMNNSINNMNSATVVGTTTSSTSLNNNVGGTITTLGQNQNNLNNAVVLIATASSNNTTSTTTNNLNNAQCIMTCGGGPTSKKLIGSSSSEDNSTVAMMGRHHDNGVSATLDDTANKTPITLSAPTPPSQFTAFDPVQYSQQQQQTNGISLVNQQHPHHQHNRPYLQHQGPVGYSQETSVDSEIQEIDITSLHFNTDKNIIESNLKGTPKPVGYITAKIPPTTYPSFGAAPHSNMTTTIITSGTGTMPISGGALHRRSSESDLSTPPKLCPGGAHMRGFAGQAGMKGGITTTVDQYGLMEYPFITISQFPPGFLTHIGGTVTARSVKLLERISNLDEPESRDAWWNEIRMEIRAHCRAFGCTVVVGYEEHTTMCDDVCVLSASGTAAIAATTIGLKNVELLTVSTKQGAANSVIADAPCPGRGVEKDRTVLNKLDNVINTPAGNGALKHSHPKLRHDSDLDPNCSMLHIPSNPAGLPFPVKMSRCHVCRKGRVPDVLIVTCEVPSALHITGKGTLIQAQVFRPKKDCKGEISAKEVSDSLPFLEYELHRRLINKLKVKGMNAIFGLKVQICLGDKLMVALATGTAMYVTALPPPGVPIITAGNLKTDAQKVLQYQKVVQDAYDRNRLHYDLKNIPVPSNGGSSGEESEEDENADIPTTTKDTYILEVDDAEDIDIISMLIDPQPTSAFLMNNIDYLHGYEEHHVSSQQMFTQVWRCRIPTLSLRQFTAYFERLLRSVCFKLRKMMPCVLSKLSFRVELPEPDEMQISIIGIALGMADQSKLVPVDKTSSGKSSSVLSVSKEDGELIFPLEEDSTGQSNPSLIQKSGELSSSGGDGSSRDLYRCTPPPPSGILVPATSQVNNSGVVLVPRYLPHQPCNISSSPHSHCSSHLSGNGCPIVLNFNSKVKFSVEITPLSYIPGAKIEKYLGNLNFFFIRETTSIRENGGLSGFVHNFVAEVLAIVRAHVAALGGNAMVSYFMTELALLHNPHKNQGQCLINVGGDVVLIVHPSSLSEDAQLCS